MTTAHSWSSRSTRQLMDPRRRETIWHFLICVSNQPLHSRPSFIAKTSSMKTSLKAYYVLFNDNTFKCGSTENIKQVSWRNTFHCCYAIPSNINLIANHFNCTVTLWTVTQSGDLRLAWFMVLQKVRKQRRPVRREVRMTLIKTNPITGWMLCNPFNLFSYRYLVRSNVTLIRINYTHNSTKLFWEWNRL